MTHKQTLFLTNMGVTYEGIKALTKGNTEQEIVRDLGLLEKRYRHAPLQLAPFVEEFSTCLWTLLGEIGVPDDLGDNLPSQWPVLIFPCGLPYLTIIEEWIHAEGAKIAMRQHRPITPLLHACLYGGQAWYPSLRKAFKKSCNDASAEGCVLWIQAGPRQQGTIATLARKVQLHLRPTLPEWKSTIPGQIYPGVQRAFHTPRLENVSVHSLILQREL